MGLLRTAGRVAVASSVHGRVQRRQQQRWAVQDQAAAAAPPPPAATAPPPPPAATPAAPATQADMVAMLVQLGELRDKGILTEEEFQQQKARLLQG